MPILAKRFWIFLLLIMFIVFIIIAVVAAPHKNTVTPKVTPTPNPTVPPTPTTVSVTINSQVGMNMILFHDQNTGASMTLTAADMPWTINVKYGETITLKALSISGYVFNTWVFGDKSIASPDTNGYLTLKATESFIAEAHFLMEVP